MNITPPYGYQEVVPLTKTHAVVLPADRKLPTLFRQLTAMPLSFTEFAFAMRDYPIALSPAIRATAMWPWCWSG